MNPRALFAEVDPLSARPKLRSASFCDRRKSELHQGAHVRASVEVINRGFEGLGRVRADRLGRSVAEPTADKIEIRRDDILKAMGENAPVFKADRHLRALLCRECGGEIITRLDRHLRRQREQRRLSSLR